MGISLRPSRPRTPMCVRCGFSRAALATCCSCGRVSRAGLVERGAQLLGADRLQQIGDGLGLEGLQRVFVEGGDEYHRRRLGQRGELARDFEAVDARHAHVEQHDVGLQPVADLERALAVLGLAGDLETPDLLQHGAQPLARRRLVVDDEHAETHAWRAASAGWNGKRSVTMYSSSKRPAFDRGALAVHEVQALA